MLHSPRMESGSNDNSYGRVVVAQEEDQCDRSIGAHEDMCVALRWGTVYFSRFFVTIILSKSRAVKRSVILQKEDDNMNERRITIDYDNRFGFAKTCTAYWTFNPDRVGEQFIFDFPNGIKVSVIRSTMWNYRYAAELLSTAASMGFAFGEYEALVWDRNGNEVEQEGYMGYKEVRRLLSRWRNFKP